MRRLLGTALVYSGTSALASGIPILLMPLLTRVLSPADYGQIAMFLLAVSFLSVGVGLGLNGALSVKYFKGDVDFPAYVNACLWITFGAAAIWALGALGLGGHAARALSLPAWALAPIVAAAAANAVILLRLAIWQAQFRALAFGGLRLTQAVVDVSASLLLVLAAGLGWQGRVAGATCAFALAGALALASLARAGYLSGPPRRDYVSDALRFGGPLVPSLVASLLLALVDRYLVARIRGVDEAGVYMVAVQIGLALNLIVVSVNQVFAPWMMRALSEDDPARDRRLVRTTYAYVAALFVIAIGLGQGTRLALGLIAGPEFQGASAAVPWVVLGVAASGGYFMVTNYVFYAERTGLLSAVMGAVGLATVALSWTLIHRFGLAGAGMAYAAGQTAMFLATWALAARVRPMPWISALRRAP